MHAYSTDGWGNLFLAGAGASAALAGVLFVAMSINLERILQGAGLPGRAGEAIVLLVAVLVVSMLGLVPGQSPTVLGGELLGFYHSHPDHPAKPSQYDLDHAWPFFSYIIVAVRAGTPEDMTSWRLREDRSAFDEERLTYAEHNQHPDTASPVHG